MFHWGKAKPAYTALATDSSDEKSSTEDLNFQCNEYARQTKRSMRTHPLFWGVHGGLFLFYLVTLGLVVHPWSTGHGRANMGLPFSPANKVLEYGEYQFNKMEHLIVEKGKFMGKPRPELDNAWHELLSVSNIAIEPEYVEHYGRQDVAIEVPEGGSYLGTLSVYHELHCLKRFHQYMYQDYYFANFTDEQRERNRIHNEHCLELLRQVAMCRGDTSLILYEWGSASHIPIANTTTHQCVNWDRLEGFMRERSVDMLRPGWLVHPLFGPAFPDGKGDEIGV